MMTPMRSLLEGDGREEQVPGTNSGSKKPLVKSTADGTLIKYAWKADSSLKAGQACLCDMGC
jgi:hypothetical protein